jgi:hypothetical protein
MISASQHFDEERDPDPDPHSFSKLDPDSHKSEKLDTESGSESALVKIQKLWRLKIEPWSAVP